VVATLLRWRQETLISAAESAATCRNSSPFFNGSSVVSDVPAGFPGRGGMIV
jgi:hypothetical protein